MNLSVELNLDDVLKKFEPQILNRISLLNSLLKVIVEKHESLWNFSNAHRKFGIHQNMSDVVATEWIPNAKSVFLIGDFNNWNEDDFQFKQIDNDLFQLIIENLNLSEINLTKIKLKIITKSNQTIYRPSPWSRYLVFNDDKTMLEAVVYCNKNEYVFKHVRPTKSDDLKIYEAHIGIASIKPEVATYSYFRTEILPRIKHLGYNTIQLMGIMEHAYYASFGYQVTNFFAASSRFGTPDDLKELIDTAHGMGLRVLLDLIHSHASSNVDDGLNRFDGSDTGFFYGGIRGRHPVWGTRLFNYSKLPVLMFLVSNLRWWIEEYQFDGFRFDGVTSMLYYDHGLNVNFSGEQDKYFDLNVDLDSVRYLMLANYFLKSYFPFVTTICEEVSGMPYLCRSLNEGGFGFDYRLGMGIPDMWIKMMKIRNTKDWDMQYIVAELCNRRDGEKTCAYAESHDQALVGDKTLAFWLMDKYMYTHMSIFNPPDIAIDRGMSLHKMIRLITHSLGGEAYLNFMGNEFGHPEWLDFPRKENKNSYFYARRQWNLVDDIDLKYKHLNNFDIRMNDAVEQFHWLSSKRATTLCVCNQDKIIAFMRSRCIFLFNFHESTSYESYKIGVINPGKYKCVLNTDCSDFGGFNRLDESVEHFSQPGNWHGHDQHILVYLPALTGQILAFID